LSASFPTAELPKAPDRTIPPGFAVDADRVLAATGFEPVIPPRIAVTDPPTAEQVALLRTVIDPVGYRKRGVRQAEANADG
jgi:glutaconate CoA-transferase, subunit B